MHENEYNQICMKLTIHAVRDSIPSFERQNRLKFFREMIENDMNVSDVLMHIGYRIWIKHLRGKMQI